MWTDRGRVRVDDPRQHRRLWWSVGGPLLDLKALVKYGEIHGYNLRPSPDPLQVDLDFFWPGGLGGRVLTRMDTGGGVRTSRSPASAACSYMIVVLVLPYSS